MSGASARRPRLLIAEESLKDHHGHFFSYARGVAEFNEADGVEVEIAAHEDVSRDLEWSLPVHAIFETSFWDGSYPLWPERKRRRREVLRANRRAYRELAAHFARSERYDLVFVPTVIVHQLLAWWAILWRFGGRKIGRAVLLLRLGPAEPDLNPDAAMEAWSTRFLRRCLRLFRPLVRRGRVRFASDNEALAREYEALCGLPFTVIPSAQRSTKELPPPRPRQAGDPVRFVSLGPAQYIKGTDVLLDAIRLLRDDPPAVPLRFVIHWPVAEAYAPDREPLRADEDLAASGWVEYVRRILSAEEYDELLCSADCAILPYLPHPYRLRTSGVLVEAALAGIPMIVAAGTTLEEGLRAFGSGLVVAPANASDLAAGIRAFAADASAHVARARERAAVARAHHAPARFQERLWGGAPPR